MIFSFSPEKNEYLKSTRDISFEKIIESMESGGILARTLHENTEKYPNQEIFYVKKGNYVYRVPFVEEDGKIFLKTAYASRVATKKFLSH